ncbi:MAG: site-specific DNA-methyltransferase [Nitrospira sp.]|nr:site-specific DNA-methyltransferase [Nitrospira sp.]
MRLLKQGQRAKIVLQNLLRSDLHFQTIEKHSILHNTHPFEGRFNPTLPKLFIEALTEQGEVVLDPMCGSGTTVIEAAMVGRVGIGLDCDPLAVKLVRMKTGRLDPGKVRILLYRIVNNAFVSSLAPPDTIHQVLKGHFGEENLDFFYDHFSEASILQLASLIREIQRVEESALKNFFEIIFSSVILHQTKKNRDTIKFFLEKGIQAMGSLEEFSVALGHASVVWGDSRSLPFEDDTIDLVITSPPSGEAMNSMQNHQYSLSWLGVGQDTFARCQDFHIGAQTVCPETHLFHRDTLPEKIVTPLTHVDRKTACILGQYFEDLAQTLCEMQRVLKPGKAAIVVIAPWVLDGMIFQVHEVIGGIAEAVGFQRVGTKAIGEHPDSENLNGNRKKICKYQEHVVGLVKRG